MYKILPILGTIILTGIGGGGGHSVPTLRPSYSFIGPPSYSDYSSYSSSSSSSSINPNKEYFYCDSYGPFPLGQEDFPLTLKYRIRTTSTSIIERLKLIDKNGSVLAALNQSFDNYTSLALKSVTYTVPIHDYWSADGLTLKFELIDKDTRELLKDYSVTFYPPEKQTFLSSVLKREVYVTRSLGFKSDGASFVPLNERYDFTNLGDYISADYYYRLAIGAMSFDYDSSFPFTYQSANMYFSDRENLFPFMEHDDLGLITIPLSLTYKNGKVTAGFKNKFYVNKKTLQVSDTYRQNFAYTSDFYLPINGLRKFNGKSLIFSFEGIGQNAIRTTITMRYDATRTYVGLCNDGEYCVVGGN